MSANPDPAPSRIIPNAFQKPNWVVDVVMRYLPGEHYKCLDVVIRKTLGWMKERDRIALSQIVSLTGISENKVRSCMKDLCGFGLTIKTDGNNAKNQGNEYALQMDDRFIDLSGLMAWDGARKAVNKRRIAAASSKGGVVSSHGSTPVAREEGGVVARRTQKPLSKANIKEEESAPQKSKIFQTYEQEFGALTPMIADAIMDAERDFPEQWILEAMSIAVERNARNWKYVRAVLDDAKAKKMSPKLNNQSKQKGKSNDNPRPSSNPTSTPKPVSASVTAEINRRRREKGVR